MSLNSDGGYRCKPSYRWDCYDVLPPIVRRALQQCSVQWAPPDIFRLLADHTAAQVVAKLRNWDRERAVERARRDYGADHPLVQDYESRAQERRT